MRHPLGYLCLHHRAAFFLGVLISTKALADISVQDYLNRQVHMKQPASRIVALAPHIVENLFAAGAGKQIVGAVDYADFPEAAKSIPRVGGVGSFSLEAIVALRPDLVITWHTGRGGEMLDKLQGLGLRVYADDPRQLRDVARSIRDFGALTDNENVAARSALAFEQRYQHLKRHFGSGDKVDIFYQVWGEPIQTLNNQHMISDVIQLCGGRNVFGEAAALAPTVSVESVIAANPAVIIASGMQQERPAWLNRWKKWPRLEAVQLNNLYFIPPDLIQRHTPRILEGAAMMCEFLQANRKR